MVIELFPELEAWAKDIVHRSFKKTCSDTSYQSSYHEQLVCHTSRLVGYPILLTSYDSPYDGQVRVQPGEQQSTVLLHVSRESDNAELAIGHEISHILIWHSNYLHIKDRGMEALPFAERIAALMGEIVDRTTGLVFPEKWFQAQFETVKGYENSTVPLRIFQPNIEGDFKGSFIECLCEEIGYFMIAERKRCELARKEKNELLQKKLF
jgi:hypothetical protein